MCSHAVADIGARWPVVGAFGRADSAVVGAVVCEAERETEWPAQCQAVHAAIGKSLIAAIGGSVHAEAVSGAVDSDADRRAVG